MKQFVVPLVTLAIFPLAAQAGCNCQSGTGVVHGAVGIPSPVVAAPGRRSEPLPPAPPPPGTLGATYQRASHPIPRNEHPRTAMLAVRDQRTVRYLRAQRMNGFRMSNGIWLFESERPLFPGADHVVRVEARQEKADIQPYRVQFVRLIPGRIVYLDFCRDPEQPEEAAAEEVEE